MSYEALEKSWADLKVNLEWEPYIFPFHSIELEKMVTHFAALECIMYLRDGSMWRTLVPIDEVLTPEQLHEIIGEKVKEAINRLIAWGRQQEEE